MKKFLAVLICVLMSIGILSSSVFAAEPVASPSTQIKAINVKIEPAFKADKLAGKYINIVSFGNDKGGYLFGLKRVAYNDLNWITSKVDSQLKGLTKDNWTEKLTKLSICTASYGPKVELSTKNIAATMDGTTLVITISNAKKEPVKVKAINVKISPEFKMSTLKNKYIDVVSFGNEGGYLFGLEKHPSNDLNWITPNVDSQLKDLTEDNWTAKLTKLSIGTASYGPKVELSTKNLDATMSGTTLVITIS